MKGVCTWEVAGRVWDYDLRYCCAVFLLKSFIPANFFKSWKEYASDLRSGAPCKVTSLSKSHDYFSFLLSSSHLLSFHSTVTFGSQDFYRSQLDFAQSPCGFDSASWKRINAGKTSTILMPTMSSTSNLCSYTLQELKQEGMTLNKIYLYFCLPRRFKAKTNDGQFLVAFLFFYNAQLRPDECTVTPKVNRESEQNYSEFTWA